MQRYLSVMIGCLSCGTLLKHRVPLNSGSKQSIAPYQRQATQKIPQFDTFIYTFIKHFSVFSTNHLLLPTLPLNLWISSAAIDALAATCGTTFVHYFLRSFVMELTHHSPAITHYHSPHVYNIKFSPRVIFAQFLRKKCITIH